MTRVARSVPSLNAIALRTTLHCLLGCSIGEILGLVLGTALGLSNGATIALAVALAFAFGYGLTVLPLLHAGFAPGRALRIALASDTLSIALMEIVDNGIMLVIPGAMDAHVGSPHFWFSMTAALVLAGLAAFPLNRWLIARGGGASAAHGNHGGSASAAQGNHGSSASSAHGRHGGAGSLPPAPPAHGPAHNAH